MKPESKIRTLSKAPAGMRRSFSRKRIAKASTFLMAGAVLSLEGAVLMSDEAQASTIWEHRRHQLSSLFEANGNYPLVFGSIKLRIPVEAVKDQSTMARSYTPGPIKVASLLKQGLVDPVRVGSANSVTARKTLLENDFSALIPNPILPWDSEKTGHIRVHVGSDVVGTLIAQIIDPVRFSSLVLKDEASPPCRIGVPPDQDQSVATALKVRKDARVLICSEIFTEHEGADKRGNNTNSVAREVAGTESQTAALAPKLQGHSYLSGAKVFVEGGIEDTVSNASDRPVGMTTSKSEANLLKTLAKLPGDALKHREDFVDPNPTPPQRPSLSFAHNSNRGSLLSELATHEYATEPVSVTANGAAFGFVPASSCRPKPAGALEVDTAARPANAKKTQTLLWRYLEAEHIGSALARSTPSNGPTVQSKGSQAALATPKTGDGWSTNASVSIISDETKIGANAQKLSNPAVLLAGDVAKGPPLPPPTLMFDVNRTYRSTSGYELGPPRTSLKALEETMAVRTGSSTFEDTMPSISLPYLELDDAHAPVSYTLGADTILRTGTLIPLGVQVRTRTLPNRTDNADSTGRLGDFALDISAIAGFETNPFLFDLPDTGTASLRLSLSPTFTRQGPRGDLRVRARLEQIEYTENFDSVQNLGANLDSRVILNERLEGNIELSYDSGVFATNLADLGLVNGASDDFGPVLGGDDVTLLGLDQPRTQYQAGGGLRYQLSERDDLNLSMSFRSDRFGRQDLPDLIETDFLLGRASYARQVGSGLTLGVAIEASNIDSVEPPLGEITTVSPQVLVEFVFSPTWELTGSLGFTSIRSDTDFSDETSTAIAGDVSICRNGIRANLCLTGGRQVVPLGIGGAGLQSNVGASYSLRLSERGTFSLSVDYGRASETFLAEGLTFETINGLLGYQLEITERVRISADARYTDLRVDLGPDVSNFQTLVGITVSLGRLR